MDIKEKACVIAFLDEYARQKEKQMRDLEKKK